MAVKKRKVVRSAAKKVVKKSTVKAKKMPAAKAKGRKVKASAKKGTVKGMRSGSISNVDKAFTKGQLLGTLAGCTGLNKKDVSCVFDELGNIIAAHLKKQGPGQFTLPGLVKIVIKHKPATKARRGVSPFTGEEMMFKAKPARNVVKVRPLQKLKEMV